MSIQGVFWRTPPCLLTAPPVPDVRAAHCHSCLTANSGGHAIQHWLAIASSRLSLILKINVFLFQNLSLVFLLPVFPMF